MDDPNLVGHVILIVEPAIDQFVRNLQDALERRGAATLIAREPSKAVEHLGAFRFSTCLINYDHASRHALIGDLADIPILLYGGESALIASNRTVPHLTCTRASVDSIMSALGRLLQPTRD